MSDSIRKRGRPRGAKFRTTKKWEPKTWLPVYTQMIALSATGMDNQSVGDQFGYTAQQVSNIRNTDNGKLVQKMIDEHIKKNMVGSISDRLQKLQDKAVGRIESVLNDDKLAETSPLAIFDRAVTFLKGTGKLVDENKGKEIERERVIVLPEKVAEKFFAGFEESNEVMRLQSGTIVNKKAS